jgi:glycosyltransferase involved in cell wall biosynthesis
MKKILMISYYYPPLADVGALRALAFSRYLPRLGWQPYVLSVKNPDKASCIPGEGEAPEGVKTFYTRSLVNLSWITGKANGLLSRLLRVFGIRLVQPLVRDLLCVPDEYIGWIPLTFLKGLSLIKKENIDVIYVSCKPFSSSITGALLKFMTNKPLVLDFRDPYSPDNALFIDRAYYRRFPVFRINEWIEEKVLRQADRLLVTTHETREQYQSCFPFIADRTEVIYNGFFEDLFEDVPPPFNTFTIVYSGNFYNSLIRPEPFFQAMQRLIGNEPELKNKIRFLYVGSEEEWLRRMIREYALQDSVRITGRVSRRQSIDYIGRASLLLLRIVHGKISTKLFEGLAAGAPMLALVQEGEVARIVRAYSSNTYYIVRPDDVDAITAAIKDGYEKWAQGLLRRSKNRQFMEDFNKRKLTADFACILDGTLPGGHATIKHCGDLTSSPSSRN